MDKAVRVRRVDHTTPSVAREIHSVQIDAYTQEAELLGTANFPPLSCTVDDIRTSQEEFFVAYHGEDLAGSISVQPEREYSGTNISSLVVAPPYQRRGIARQLMAEVLRLYAADILTVQTAAKNDPALTLYAQLGFVEYRRWRVGPESLELVKLRRFPSVES
jgi:ribosomal protein S18 acetylase RimI-like enzyme